ncbi:FtsX-like permease family protein [Cutibacterium sp. WCA-380-WT-3A]|uniref:FtsX-like permease family protein n=1 Tax=Cutibacterium porci TaxID=2605781 RepID=A0A7K0J4M6_9ACTN|nr:FtsX-like permease family protein [Cutibacterium porci]MSS44890.1 FtsX-like permease family protein [Cutibacterium porci]
MPENSSTSTVRLSGDAIARGRPHRRLINRLAVRDVGRHKMRSLLIVMLIALPVAIMSGLGVLLRSDGSISADQSVSNYGDADMVISPMSNWDGHCFQQAPSDAYCAGSAEPDARQRTQQQEALANLELPGREMHPLRTIEASVSWRLTTLPATVKAMDLTTMRPYRMELPRGPMPTGNNIWVTTGAAKDFSWSVGSRVTVNGHQYAVTGLVREGWSGRGPVIWVAPNSPLAHGGELSYYVKGASLTKQQVKKLNASGVGVADRRADESINQDDSTERMVFALSLAAGVLSAIVVATIAAAAFAIGARQQRRMLALLGITGAARRDLMGVMIHQGLLLGLSGALLGVGLGVGLGNGAVAIIRTMNPDYITYGVDWGYVTVGFVVGLLAALAACWFPARDVARQDVLMGVKHAESAAPPARRPILAIVIAVMSVLAGVGGVIYSHRGTNGDAMVRLNIGIIITIVVLYVAVVFALPWLVDKISGRKSSSLSIRFALRDLNRNRGRAVPGVAASMAIVVLACAAVTLCQSVAIQDRAQYRPELGQQIGVLTGEQNDGLRASDNRVSEEIQRVTAVFGPQVKYLRPEVPVTCSQDGKYCYSNLEVAAKVPDAANESTVTSSTVIIDDGTLYELLTGEKADGRVMKALDEGVILFSPDAPQVSQAVISNNEEPPGTDTTVLPAIQAPRHAMGYGMPNLISRKMAAKVLGVSPDKMKTQSSTVWLRLPHTPTAQEGEQLQRSLMDVTGSPSEFMWEVGYSDVAGAVVRWAAVVGAVLALCVGAVVLALTLSDSRSSRTGIATVGASKATLRRIVAAQTLVTTGLGQALGFLVGFVPAVVMTCLGSHRPAPMPLPWLALIVLVPPVLLSLVMMVAVPVPRPKMQRLD